MRAIALCMTLAVVACGADDNGDETSECPAPVNASTSAVTTMQAVNAASSDLYVCDGGELVLNAASGTVYVASGGQAVLNGTGATVYVEGGGQVVLNAAGATVFREAGATVRTNASATATTNCGVIRPAARPTC